MRGLGRHKSSRSATTGPAADCPAEGTRVRLRLALPGGSDSMIVEIPTVVTAVEESATARGRTQVEVSARDVEFLPAAPDGSAEQSLVWTTSGGQMELPVLVPSLHGDAWPLTVAGPPRRVQRREFVRVGVRLAAVITLQDARPEAGHEQEDAKDDVGGPTAPEDAGTAGGQPAGETGGRPEEDDAQPGPLQWATTVIDLGEGGVRCVVEGHPPAQGARVVVAIGIGDTPIDCAGVVLRHFEHHSRGVDATVLAVRFDDPEEHGDTIRRAVFAEQLRLRQSRLTTRED